jgi:hypothetical protein
MPATIGFIFMATRYVLLCGLAAFLLLAGTPEIAEAAGVSVSVETKHPGNEISHQAVGLSYETSLMLPRQDGTRYFRSDNAPLIRAFQTVGIKSLRIGGNSVDAPEIPVPGEQDIRSLFDFARAAKVKVIYSVRLQNGDPQSAAAIARIIHQNYADTLECFAIGNEPVEYYNNKKTDAFLAKWTAICDAIVGEWPDAKFCGPDDNPLPKTERRQLMVHNFGAPAGPLVQISVHSYPFGCSYRNPKDRKTPEKLIPVDAADAREQMLSPKAYAIYEQINQGIQQAVAGTPISFRLTETNSFWFSGLNGASNSYASALWAADYLHWWTAHGADGLNFHTGDRTGGALSMPCMYAAFVTSGNGYEIRPLSYGLKLVSLAGAGRTLTANVIADTDQNLAAYAVLAEDKTVAVTLINKAHGAGASSVEVEVKLDAPMSSNGASAIFLTEEKSDISAGASRIRLGGASIGEDGEWNGKWESLPATADAKVIKLTMPPASAAVVRTTLDAALGKF